MAGWVGLDGLVDLRWNYPKPSFVQYAFYNKHELMNYLKGAREVLETVPSYQNFTLGYK